MEQQPGSCVRHAMYTPFRGPQMTMNDPRVNPPPPRGPYQRQDNTMGWVLGAIVAALVVGGIWWV